MVALKKLFLAEKYPSRPVTSLGFEGSAMRDPYFHMTVDSPARSHFGDFPSSASQSLDVAHHFDQIEKQFEDLHDSLQRPTSVESELPPLGDTNLTAVKPQNGRHIDLMDALNYSERPQTIKSEPLSPLAGPYNEDVAERNMTRFLRIQYRNGVASSRILAALYQEDVADRNIAKYNKDTRTSSNLSSQSSPAAPGRVRIPDGVRRKFRKRNPGKPSWASAENLRTRKHSRDDGSGTTSQEKSNQHLRHQRSAPSLSADEGFVPQENAPPSPVQRLGVPPAYKLGKRWSNTPLPDSPTIPVPMGESDGAAEAPSVPRSPAVISRRSSATSGSCSPTLSPPVPGSKKNVRDLSINTKLASKGRPKIGHRAIQPPTPSTGSMKRAPSIAEVMNSPLPVPTPASPPKESPRLKASELMDLFSKAFTSIPGNHPTYETLQDAIVREINSHEAFRRVPVPVPGPPFTPTPGNDRFAGPNHEPGLLSRNASAKGRLASKGSFTKHKRNSESRRSISSSVGYDKIRRKVAGSPARRHTDAPPPTPGFLADAKTQESIAPRLAAGETITYMDVLRASSEGPTSSHGFKVPAASRKRGRSESAGNLATLARTVPDAPSTPGTIYCMQAHSTPSTSESQEESDDDDIIQLPSVNMSPPRVQIEGVDEPNVRYVIDGASNDDPKLMHWPPRSGRFNRNSYGNSLSPSSPVRMQIRGSRSVEAY
ncbi:uncharacterized protein N7511_002416 [Penicillium nucicola]|uniref:uncharacterized protein n=1 Tax=Penicillium nucicola TaxID=1850975 RepID=UPI002545BB07|nr:uncharacterized protein N7511_002416 [Penicillium nucicola]KAJ5770365.1 hypothetical protein N7511_002416 [Penicillium nucicola]